MNGHMFTSTFMFRMQSQADWRMPERCEMLIPLAASPAFGTFTCFAVNKGPTKIYQEFSPADLIVQARYGDLEFLDLEGEIPVPTSVTLSWTKLRHRPHHDFPVGFNMLALLWSRKAGPIPSNALRAWTNILEQYALPLAIRYGHISCPQYSSATFKQSKKWISPQYARHAGRVMLFGPRELERFGRDYLLAAPAHEVKLLDCGSVLIIASPHSLDPSAPEDEEALARLNDYLLAHPRAGVLM